jgi:hypothetical protein
MFTCGRNTLQLGYHQKENNVPLAFDPDNWKIICADRPLSFACTLN